MPATSCDATDTTGIVTINQIHPIFVGFALPADSLPQLRAGMKNGDIAVTARGSPTGRTSPPASSPSSTIRSTPATATINYKAVFDNADDALWPGQFVNVRVSSRPGATCSRCRSRPSCAARTGAYAFVVGSDRSVQKRPIKVGVTNKDIAIIDDGLHAGEQVVTDGQYRIQAGSLVEVLPPARDDRRPTRGPRAIR